MIQVKNVLTCVPRTEDDVVAVCNWAAGAGFTVRPRGIMHTWSPLTVTQDQPVANVMLIDLTQNLNKVLSIAPAGGGSPAHIVVQTGATMDALMAALEGADGGKGPAHGFSFAHTPAPGNLTVGGALAINAHGTAVPTPPDDDFDVPYGSLSNQILGFTAVVTMPGAPGVYTKHTFTRGDADAKAFLAHCGRALLLEVTLQVTDNYNLRCQSDMKTPATTLFARPTGPTPPPGSVGDHLDRAGRIEVIWFPSYPGHDPSPPWLKVWTVSATKPSGAKQVGEPYNYWFSDNLPDWVTDLLKTVVMVPGGASQTPFLSGVFAQITSFGLYNWLNPLTDLWGPSKNTLLYVKDTTLRVTANGYAVLMKQDQVQQTIADFTEKFTAMLGEFQNQKLWPINSPLEIRVTGLDDPAKIAVGSGKAESPVISSLHVDPEVVKNGWDVACWFDVLTVIPRGDPQQAFRFYKEMEDWFYAHFATGFRVCPEWSKGWAYTSANGAWTDAATIQKIRAGFNGGGQPEDDWKWEVETLAKYDSAHLFANPFLNQLFTL